MLPTPDDHATDRADARLEQILDAWGRAAGHELQTRAMPPSIAGAVTARRRVRRAQQGVGAVALAIGVIALGSMLLPSAAPIDPAPDDRPLRAQTLTPRLLDIQRANPSLDADDLRLPEAKFGGVREALGLRNYEPLTPIPDAERLSPREKREEPRPPR